MKKTIISLFSLFVIISLVSMPSQLLSAASEGIDIWLFSVFPSLFPFMVSCNMLIMCGTAQYFGKVFALPFRNAFGISSSGAFALFTGLLCGYPMGAKTASSLYENRLLSSDEANRLLYFTTNAGPAFIVSAVATRLLDNTSAGYIILFATTSANLITGIAVCRFSPCAKKSYTVFACENCDSLSVILSDSIVSSLKSVTIFGGYIIFFCVVTKILDILNIIDTLCFFIPHHKETSKALLFGMIEMTGGLKRISVLDASLQLKASLSAFLLNFGGLCVHLQCYDFFRAIPNASLLRFSFFKLLTALISAVITYLAY